MFLKEGNQFKLIKGTPEGIYPKLDPGVYALSLVREGNSVHLMFKKDDRYRDTNILDAGVFKRVENYIDNFVCSSMAKARGVLKGLNKLGLMFLGNPGTGKTFLAGQIAQKLVCEKKAIAIMINEFWKYNLSSLVDGIRENNPDDFVVVIMDEFEKCQSYQLQDPDLLAFLDGNNSKDNILILAMANATSNMKDFLTDRPGRFEQIFNFDEKDDKVVEALVESMTPSDYKDRIDTKFIATQLIAIKKTSVDNIKIAIRDAIAEIIHFDDTGAFRTFNSLNLTEKETVGKTIGFKNTNRDELTKQIQKLEDIRDDIDYEEDD